MGCFIRVKGWEGVSNLFTLWWSPLGFSGITTNASMWCWLQFFLFNRVNWIGQEKHVTAIKTKLTMWQRYFYSLVKVWINDVIVFKCPNSLVSSFALERNENLQTTILEKDILWQILIHLMFMIIGDKRTWVIWRRTITRCRNSGIIDFPCFHTFLLNKSVSYFTDQGLKFGDFQHF